MKKLMITAKHEDAVIIVSGGKGNGEKIRQKQKLCLTISLKKESALKESYRKINLTIQTRI